MNVQRPLTGAERVAKRRAALRAQGLRPRTFWLPDTTTPEFQARARVSCAWLWDRAIEEEQVMAWVDSINAEVFADLDRREEELRPSRQG